MGSFLDRRPASRSRHHGTTMGAAHAGLAVQPAATGRRDAFRHVAPGYRLPAARQVVALFSRRFPGEGVAAGGVADDERKASVLQLVSAASCRYSGHAEHAWRRAQHRLPSLPSRSDEAQHQQMDAAGKAAGDSGGITPQSLRSPAEQPGKPGTAAARSSRPSRLLSAPADDVGSIFVLVSGQSDLRPSTGAERPVTMTFPRWRACGPTAAPRPLTPASAGVTIFFDAVSRMLDVVGIKFTASEKRTAA